MKPSDLGERAIKESYIALDPDSDHETYHTRFCASLIAPSDALCPSFLHLAPMFAVTHHPCFRKSTPIMQWRFTWSSCICVIRVIYGFYTAVYDPLLRLGPKGCRTLQLCTPKCDFNICTLQSMSYSVSLTRVYPLPLIVPYPIPYHAVRSIWAHIRALHRKRSHLGPILWTCYEFILGHVAGKGLPANRPNGKTKKRARVE